MNRATMARLAKLEAHRSTGRIVPIFVWGQPKTDFEAEVAARKAEMIRTGQASEHDEFLVFTTIYEEPPEQSVVAAV